MLAPQVELILKNTILFFILLSIKPILQKSGVSIRSELIKYFRAQVTQRPPHTSEISNARTYFPLVNVNHVAFYSLKIFVNYIYG